MRVDLGGVQTASGSDFAAIEPGVYHCRVTGAKDEENGTRVQIEFTVTAGPHANRKIWDRLFSSHKALARLKLAAEAMGFDCNGPVDLTAETLVGREVFLRVEQETYEGKLRNKVAFDGYESVESRQRIAAAVKKLPTAAARVQPTAAAVAPQAANEDQVPF